MRRETGSAWVAGVADAVLDLGGGLRVRSWRKQGLTWERPGTAFVMAFERAELETADGCFPLPAGGYAVLPGRATISGGSGVLIEHADHRGLFLVGGPVEPTGRLRYIDGCRDTLLVAPVVRGDPCLNLLSLPPGLVQTDHEHPSERVGLVVAGGGVCVSGPGRRDELGPGSLFVLPPHLRHRFESDPDAGLLLMAWHPDSDSGPTDDDHPMLNRTLRPGSTERITQGPGR